MQIPRRSNSELLGVIFAQLSSSSLPAAAQPLQALQSNIEMTQNFLKECTSAQGP